MKKPHGMTGKRNAFKTNGRRHKIMICLSDDANSALVAAAESKGLKVSTLAGDLVAKSLFFLSAKLAADIVTQECVSDTLI